MNTKHNSKVLIFTGCYLPGFRGGGPIRSIANMVEKLSDHYEFSIITSDRDLGEKNSYQSISPKKWNVVGKTSVLYTSKGYEGVRQIYSVLKSENFTTISLNSFFSLQFSIIPIIICGFLQKKTTIIIGPRGEFSTGALGMKGLKKRIFIRAAKFSRLYKHVIWHASSNYEAADIRAVMGDNSNVRIAVNISTPGNYSPWNIRSKNTPLRVLFISRISPMKNLVGAIEILRQVRKDVFFTVYGPAEDQAYWETCQSIADSLPKNVKFEYCGALMPTEVASTMSKFDLFFLPTLGENFGHVIAEAFSAGLPVLISDATPWKDLSKKSLGWEISLNQPEEFVACIEECCGKTAEEYNDWRNYIRRWATANIGNEDAIEQNRKLFMDLK